jgi:cytochrome bd-type quinol oxidase subunit 1
MKNRTGEDQAKNNEPDAAWESASRGFARGVGNLTHDILTLADLQVQLLSADVQECSQRLLIPALLLCCGVAVGLACFPIALTAFALFLAQQFSISAPTGFVIAFLVGGIFGALLSIVGWRQVVRQLGVLRRSQQELIRNLRWIRKVIDHSRAP